MCTSPIWMPAAGASRRCGVCAQCIRQEIADLCGRCVAELHDPLRPPVAFAVDLTMRNEGGVIPENALVLCYSDVEKLWHRIRKYKWRQRQAAGLPAIDLRFLVAGEIGPRTNRAHWHALIFLRDNVGPPELCVPIPRLYSRQNWELWPLGYSWFKECTISTIHYAVKYLRKPEPGDDRLDFGYSKKSNYSKRPALGDAFFASLAAEHVSQGLAVHDALYRFRGVTGRNGRPWEYFMMGHTRDLFLQRYVEGWNNRYGGLPPLTEFLVENYFDPLAKAERLADPEDFAAMIAAKQDEADKRRRKRAEVLLREGRSSEVARSVFDRRHVATLLLPGLLAVAFSDAALCIGLTAGGKPAERAHCRAEGSARRFVVELGFGEALADEVGAWWRERVVPLLDPAGAVYAPVLLDGATLPPWEMGL